MGLLDLTVVEMKMYFPCWPEGKISVPQARWRQNLSGIRSFPPQGQFLC